MKKSAGTGRGCQYNDQIKFVKRNKKKVRRYLAITGSKNHKKGENAKFRDDFSRDLRAVGLSPTNPGALKSLLVECSKIPG